MDPKALVEIILNFVLYEPLVTRINKADIPDAPSSALAKWASSRNLPLTDPDTTADFYEINIYHSRAHLAVISRETGEQFQAAIVIRSGTVLGEYIDFSSHDSIYRKERN